MKILAKKAQATADAPPPATAVPTKSSAPTLSGQLRAPNLVATAPVDGHTQAPERARAGLRKARLDHLTSGRRFDVQGSKSLKAITGQAITLDGLTRLYEKALQSSGMMAHSRVRITGSAQKGHFAYTVTYVDNQQRRVATARRRLVQHEDGSMELYRHGTWVDPEQRGRGFAANMLRQEIGLITALSDHPETRLTLWAGGARNPKKSADVQNVGVYVWAKAGFATAQTPSSLALGGDKPRCEDDPGREAINDLDLMRRQLGLWIDTQVEAGSVTRPQAKALNAQAKRFEHPFEFAELGLGQTTFNASVGDAQRPCALGKAFLLSPLSPRWEGALKVNEGGPGMQRVEAYLAQAAAQEGQAEAAQTASWLADLGSQDPGRQKTALATIGALGGTGFVPALNALLDTQPELSDVVKETLQKVRGRWKPPRPKITYSTHGGQARVFSLPNQYADLAKLSAGRLGSIAVSDSDHRRAQAALQQLATSHMEKASKTVLEAATKVYKAYPDDERWLVRQSAVQILSKVPEEAGIPALIEASKTEDDINIMVALHRTLDNAEHPAAVEPADALSVRIEVMKAEIEKALAELG